MEKILNELPRVLVSTVPAWSKGSNTISSLFKGYDKSKLSCLYIRADKSDAESCDRYFHIFEGRVLSSILRHNIKTGEEYILTSKDRIQSVDDSKDVQIENRRYNFFRRHSTYLFTFIREFVWLLGKWNTKEFNKYIDSVNPEVFVFPIESYIHFNRINEYIINKKHPKKIIGFLWDDNFTYKQLPYSLGYKLHRFWLRKHVKCLVSKCDRLFVLSPKMKRECDLEFNVNSELLTKPIFNNGCFVSYKPKKPIRILYTGSMIIGRDKTLLEVAKAIQKVNTSEVKVVLDIYSGTLLPKKVKQKIEKGNFCKIHGPIKQSEVFEKQKESDILLFVESLSGINLTARLSFSTKLTDYFSAGKCIWAIGNGDLGPIEYLKYNDSGLVSTNVSSLSETLNKIVSTPSLIEEYAMKSFDCGVKNHNENVIKNKFKEVIIK